jgi:phosphoribosylformimino-5-aminoimidazole carboxamide ribotide isomerase
MTKFRPCIDLHSGQVKQIVGGTLSQVAADLKTNYVSKLPASHYAGLYQKHDLRGGHVVKLGPGNEEAAQEALKTWPGGLQVAGGITDKNAQYWIDQGADKVSTWPPDELQFLRLSVCLIENSMISIHLL